MFVNKYLEIPTSGFFNTEDQRRVVKERRREWTQKEGLYLGTRGGGGEIHLQCPLISLVY